MVTVYDYNLPKLYQFESAELFPVCVKGSGFTAGESTQIIQDICGEFSISIPSIKFIAPNAFDNVMGRYLVDDHTIELTPHSLLAKYAPIHEACHAIIHKKYSEKDVAPHGKEFLALYFDQLQKYFPVNPLNLKEQARSVYNLKVATYPVAHYLKMKKVAC